MKNKYKVHWSFLNLLSDTQAEVVKLQQIAKGFTATVTTGTWIGADADHAIWVGLGGMLLDMILGCFYFEKIEK